MQVTWWGHSTVALKFAGVRLLTDPVLTGTLGHLRRRRGPLPAASAIHVDAVLISHLHADHLHVPSLRRLDPSIRLLAPVAASGVFRDLGARSLAARCEELAPGDAAEVTTAGGGSVTVTTTAAAHDDHRAPWSRRRGPALEFVLAGDGERVWFPGDTGLHDELESVGAVDLGLVPVGGWGLTLGPGHLNPSRAAEASRRVGIRHAVPIHYGTLWPRGMDRVSPHLFHPPGAEYAACCGAVSPATTVHVLDPGESLTLPGDDHSSR